MATTLRNSIASIGVKRVATTAPAVASQGYARAMNAQFKAIMDSYKKMLDVIDEVVPDIMVEALEPTLKLAQYYCPKDTHRLVNSGFVEKRPSTRNQMNAVIGFAKNGFPDYAAIVHERVDIPHAAPTRSKFLETALLEDMGNVFGRIVTRCKI